MWQWRNADRADIRRALTMLGPREQLILERRFGFTGPPETLNEVADELGLTRERIRQLEQQALGRLANALTGSRLEAVS